MPLEKLCLLLSLSQISEGVRLVRFWPKAHFWSHLHLFVLYLIQECIPLLQAQL
jgi:hypothetical protein